MPKAGALAVLISLCIAAPAAVSAASTKISICGLVTMGDLSFLTKSGNPTNNLEEAKAHPNIYSAAVILATWAQLEPEKGRLDTRTIDDALAQIREYNRAHPSKPIAGKLRVFAGENTPAWVKALAGGPIQVASDKRSVQIGRFWTPEYRSAWANLQRQLAAKYDGDPLMGEVAVSSCSSLTAEPFILPATPSALATMHAAGFTDSAYKACLASAVTDYDAWKRTPLDYTFNPFDSTDGKRTTEPQFTLQVMEQWRSRLGARGVIANHGLSPDAQARQADIYSEFTRSGPPVEFQFVAPNIDLATAALRGLAYHPTEIEVFDSTAAGGHAAMEAPMLEQWRSRMTCSH